MSSTLLWFYNGKRVERGEVVTLVDGAALTFAPTPRWEKAWLNTWGTLNRTDTILPNADGVFHLGPMSPGRFYMKLNDSTEDRTNGFNVEWDVTFVATAQRPQPVQTKRLIISDVGSFLQLTGLMDELPAHGQRPWCSVLPDGTVNPNALNHCRAMKLANRFVIACVSLRGHPTSYPNPKTTADSIRRIIKPGDVDILELGNEVDLARYNPGGNVQAGYAWYSRVSELLPEYNTYGPSQAHDMGDSVVEDIETARKAGNFNFKGIAAHDYHDDNQWTDHSLKAAERNVGAIASIGLPVAVTEWGCNATYTTERKKFVIPRFPRIYERIGVVAWAYYLATKTNDPTKPDADLVPWAVDFKTNTRSEFYPAVKEAYSG